MKRTFITHSNAAKLLGLSNVQLEAFIESNDINIYVSDNGLNYNENIITRLARGLMSAEHIADAYLRFDDEKYFYNKEIGLPSSKEIQAMKQEMLAEQTREADRRKMTKAISHQNSTEKPAKRKRAKTVRKEETVDRHEFVQSLIDNFSSSRNLLVEA